MALKYCLVPLPEPSSFKTGHGDPEPRRVTAGRNETGSGLGPEEVVWVVNVPLLSVFPWEHQLHEGRDLV